MIIDKRKLLFAILISLDLLLFVSCEPITPVPNSIQTITPAFARTPNPTKTPAPLYYSQLVKLAELGKGILPEITHSPDGKIIAVNDGYVLRLLDANNHSEITSIEVSTDGYSRGVKFSPYGQFLTMDGGIGFRVFDIKKQEFVAHGSGGNGGAYGPVFTPDNKYILYLNADRSSGGPYHSICLMEIESEEIKYWYPVSSGDRYDTLTLPSVSPDGNLVAAGYRDSTNNILYIWNVMDGTIRYEIKGQPSSINSVDFSPDGKTLASAGEDGVLRLWDPLSGKLKRVITGFRDDIWDVEFSSIGNELIVRVANEEDVLYNLEHGQRSSLPSTGLDPLAAQMLEEGYLLAGGGSRIVFSPDGRFVAVGHGSIQIWDTQSHELLTTLTNGNQSIRIAGMTYSPDGNHLGVITTSGEIFSWNVHLGKQELALRSGVLFSGQVFYASGVSGVGPAISARTGSELGIAYSPDGNRIVFGNDISVEVWDMQLGNKIMTLEQIQPVAYPTSVSYSFDGKRIYGVLNRNRDVAVWDAVSGKLIRKLNLPDVDPNAFTTVSLQGSLFARNNYDENDYWVEIWNLDTNQMTKLPTHLREVEPLRLSADGKFLTALIDHQQIYTWRVDNGQLIFVSNKSFDIGDMAVSPDGKLLATADFGKVSLWDVEKLSAAAFLPGFTSPVLPPAPTPSFSINNDSPISTPQIIQTVESLPAPSLHPDAITMKNLSEIREISSFGNGTVESLIWSPSSNTILVSGSKGSYQYDPQTLDEVDHFEPDGLWATSSQTLADGRILVAGATKNGKVQVWDATSNRMLVELSGGGEPSLSPDGRWLVFANGISGLNTWDFENGRSGVLLRSDAQSSSWPIFSPDNRLVAAIQSDNSVRVWDLQTGSIINAVGGPEAEITDLSFSADGSYLIGAAGGTGWVWNIKPGHAPFTINIFPGHVNGNLTLYDDTVTSIALSMDNSLIALGTSEPKIWLYDRRKGKIVGNMTDHASAPIEMSFSPDAFQLVSVDQDGQMILWNIAKQRPLIISHPHTSSIMGLVTREDGKFAAWVENTVWTVNPKNISLTQTTYVSADKVLAVSPAGDLIAGYNPLRVSLYDAMTGELRNVLPEEAVEPWIEYYWEGEIFQQFYGAVFNPEGTRLATYGSGGIWMYDLPSGNLVTHFEGNHTEKTTISKDGEWLVASPSEGAASPLLVRFQDAKMVFYLEGGRGWDYLQYAISPDKLWIGLIKKGWDEPSKLQLVDSSTGQIAKELLFDDELLTSLTFSLDSTFIAVGFEDGHIILVDVNTMDILTTLDGHKAVVNCLAFSTDGRYLFSGGQDGVVKIWGLP